MVFIKEMAIGVLGMKIIHVYSANTPLGIPPFVDDLGKHMARLGHEVNLFGVKGKGWKSYLSETLRLRKYIRDNPCDIIHGHYIWSVLVGALQGSRQKKIGSYIGSDLNIAVTRKIARFAVTPLLDGVIVMNSKMAGFLRNRKKILVTPYGVDCTFFSQDTIHSVAKHGLIKDGEINILFSSRFDRAEKNVKLAREACAATGRRVNLIEFRGLSRLDIVQLMNQVDLVLMTSLWEGSPQVIKEAMSCNCPVVSTDVGDVAWLLKDVKNTFVCQASASKLATAIMKVIDNGERSNGRDRILSLGINQPEVSRKILAFYESVL